MSVPVDEVLLDAIDTVTYELAGLAERIRAAKVNDTPVKHPTKPIKPKPKPPPKPKDMQERRSAEMQPPALAERVTILEEDLAKLRKEVAAYNEAESIIRRATAWPRPSAVPRGTPAKDNSRVTFPRFRAVKP